MVVLATIWLPFGRTPEKSITHVSGSNQGWPSGS